MAIKKGSQILFNLLFKDAVKKSGQASGIMSIGDSVRNLAKKRLQSYLLAAKKQGVDIDAMNEQEIKYMLEMNKPQASRVISADSPEGKGITEALLGKRGQVIKADFGKPFKEEIGSVDNIVNDITRMEPIAAMKEVNKVLGKKGKYKNLSKQDSEKIFNNTDDWVNQKDPADLYDYKNKRPFREDPNFDPDNPDFNLEDFANGGRVNFRSAGAVQAAYGNAAAKKGPVERPSNDRKDDGPPSVISTPPTRDKSAELFKFDEYTGKPMTYADVAAANKFLNYVKTRGGYSTQQEDEEGDALYDAYRTATGSDTFMQDATVDAITNQRVSQIDDGDYKAFFDHTGTITDNPTGDMYKSLMVQTPTSLTQRFMTPSGIIENDVPQKFGAPQSLSLQPYGRRIGFAEGNGVYDEDVAKKKFGERVRQLMDEGYDFGEAVKEAMKEEGFADGGIARMLGE